MENKKVAIVHDFLVYWGGAEKVLEALAEMFPTAPIYTLLYDKERMRGKFEDREIRTSFLQKFPKFLRKRHRWLLPLMPVAPETFDLREFDLVISSSGAWSKGIVTKLDTVHVAYVHSPMRFVWDYSERYLSENRKGWLGFLLRPFFNYLRIWDKMAGDRPEFLIANSKYTQSRIEKYYRRESAVIFPPAIEEKNIKNIPENNFSEKKYFLVVSRLANYKKTEAIVEAFNELELPLVVVGEGEQKEYLKKIAGKNVRIVGWQSEESLEKIYAGARAFVLASVEDFGIGAVEAMASGVPALALNRGGAREIIIVGKTGEFFQEPTTESITEAVKKFVENEKNYDRKIICDQARKFSKERFQKELGEFLGKI